MHMAAPRTASRPRALIVAALAAFTLTACVDEPVAPTPTTKANLARQGAWPTVVVTNTSGGTEVGSLRWAAQQVATTAGTIEFDPSLGGKTITLEAGLYFPIGAQIGGPEGGITISGNDKFTIIKSRGSLVLEGVTLTKGYSEFGSAIQGVNVFLNHTTVRDNRWGTAISIEKGIWLTNSTISNNSTAQPAIYYLNGSTVSIDHSTIAFNGPGAGIGNFSAPNPWAVVTLRNAIISNNGIGGSPQQNCLDTIGFTYYGTNISDDSSCGQVGMTVADPKLLPLADNGGPNWTHAIPHTSPAFNTGFYCDQFVDQRYSSRDAKCDVGAFEFNDWTKVAITIDPTVKLDATGKAVLTGTVRCTREDTFRLALEVHQDQKVGKTVVDVHGANDIPVACTPAGTPWTAAVGLSAGETFQVGAARATAMTFLTPEWVTPANVASAVKISGARR